MPDEFPYSETEIIDATEPTDGSVGVELDDEIRKDRRALNFLYARAGLRHFRHVDHPPLTLTMSVSGDKFVEVDMAEVPTTLTMLTDGYQGQIIYLTCAESDEAVPDKKFTLHHNSQYLDLLDGADVVVEPGDVVCLWNTGDDLEDKPDIRWKELFREIGGALYGFMSPSGDRWRLSVTDQGAVKVTEI